MRGCVQLVQVLQAFMSAPHLATPTNFFLHLAFSGPLSSPHAYATRAGPTLDWPLSSYKPGSPRALTCSPLRACQSCLPGAQRLIRVAPISHLLCGLLALSSASLHRLVSQSTRNMIDWLGFLFPCAFLYTTNSPVACGVRVCKLLPCSISADPLPARGKRWGSVRLALERDCGSLLPSLSPSPVQPCTLPAFFLSLFSCSSSFLFFPFPFCCRRTPLVGARCGHTSAAWKSAGSEAFLAGRSL